MIPKYFDAWLSVSYHNSDRTFQMDSCSSLRMELDACGPSPIGGVTVNLYLDDKKRYANMAFGLAMFFELAEEAVAKFSSSEIEYPKAERGAELLEDRNEFLRLAVEQHPAILIDLARKFRRLASQAEEGAVRLSSLKAKNL